MLNPLSLDLGTFDIPGNVSRIIDSAWTAIQQFQLATRKNPVHGFHPGDFSEAFQWLIAIRDSGLLPNKKFCEWGSGFAVVSLIAVEIGFQSVAIESDEELFRAAGAWQNEIADELSDPFKSRLQESIESYWGSFIPTTIQNSIAHGAEPSRSIDTSAIAEQTTKWIDHSAQSVFEQCRWFPDDFGLTYAYPWPGEENFIFELFDLVAKPEALLLTFHGAADFRLHQKTDCKTAD